MNIRAPFNVGSRFADGVGIFKVSGDLCQNVLLFEGVRIIKLFGANVQKKQNLNLSR